MHQERRVLCTSHCCTLLLHGINCCSLVSQHSAISTQHWGTLLFCKAFILSQNVAHNIHAWLHLQHAQSLSYWNSSVSLHLGPITTNTTYSVRNLGVVFDQYLNFNQHIKNLVKSCNLQIRNIAKVKPMLPKITVEQLIHTLISSCRDYCNSLFICLNYAAVARLQLVQNVTARLLTNIWRRELLAKLHWLPIRTVSNLRFYWLLLNPYIVWLHFTSQNS